MKSVSIQFLILASFITVSLGIASAAILWGGQNELEEEIISADAISQTDSQNTSQKPSLVSNVPQSLDQKIEKVEIYSDTGSAVFNVELADTPKLRTQGLSGRKQLNQNSGLLFLFEKSAIYSFWMKDMNFPLDIIWINEDNLVVHIEKNLKPETFPNIFSPKSEALFVLEVNAGLVDQYKIKLGSKVKFLPENCLLACV